MNFDSKKVKSALKSSIGFFAVFLVCASYILLALVEIIPGKRTIMEIFGNTAILFLLGISINEMMGTQGMLNGMRDDLYRNTVSLHGDTVLRISKWIDRLDEWCEIKNAENLRDHRIKLLASKGMRYDDYFGEKGAPYVPNNERLNNKYTRKEELSRIKTYNKAVSMKLTPLTAGSLTTNASDRDDPYKSGRSKSKFLAQQLFKDAISKMCISLVLGYFSVDLIKDFSWSVLIWHTLQVCVFVVFGVLKMEKSYMFVTDEYRQGIVQKIDNLNKFECWANANCERSLTDGENI